MLNCHCPPSQKTQKRCVSEPPGLRFYPVALKVTEGDVGTTVTFHRVMQASMPRSLRQARPVTSFAALATCNLCKALMKFFSFTH